jgi:hypothetical protein
VFTLFCSETSVSSGCVQQVGSNGHIDHQTAIHNWFWGVVFQKIHSTTVTGPAGARLSTSDMRQSS